METIPLEVYSQQTNHAVVRIGGRKFPGALIQGDSLFILCDEAKQISARLRTIECADDEILFLAQEHQEKLLERLLHFQQVLLAHGLPLPYSSAASQDDLVVLVSTGGADAL